MGFLIVHIKFFFCKFLQMSIIFNVVNDIITFVSTVEIDFQQIYKILRKLQKSHLLRVI